VRRLTTTLVDVLRTLGHTGATDGDKDGLPMHHRRDSEMGLGLGLSDAHSELSLDDKLSMSSGPGSSRDTCPITAHTALLRATFMQKDDYRGEPCPALPCPALPGQVASCHCS
jgi:hypothetical protein